MAGTSELRSLVASLFVEPLHGFNEAQAAIIDTWLNLLKSLMALPEGDNRDQIIRTAIDQAPKWHASIKGDVSVLMRITKLRRAEGSLSLGVAVGPFQGAGSFGFTSESASESVIQARAAYIVSNAAGETSLSDLLSSLGLPDQINASNVAKAETLLGEFRKSLSKSE